MDNEQSIAANFSFLIIIAHPEKNRVKLYIDDGSVSFFMKNDLFIREMSRFFDKKMITKLTCILQEYGTCYLLDRKKLVIEKVRMSDNKSKMSYIVDCKNSFFNNTKIKKDDFIQNVEADQKRIKNMLKHRLQK